MSFGPGWQRLLLASPIFARELRQALRTGRVVALVLGSAVLIGLFTFAVASAFGLGKAQIAFGPVLFQVFFSLAYFTIAIVAPCLGAIAVASEKERRTWEGLVLTGMGPRAVVLGAFATTGLAVLAFILMIAPASTLCVVLGGVSTSEIVFAFVLLLAIAFVGVAHGVTIGAWARGTATATLAALASALFGALLLYFAVGIGFSFLAHATWPGVPNGFPVWLPLAYARARLDGWYLLLLVAVPLALLATALWFLFETARLELSDPWDDRSTGRKRWFLVSLPLVSGVALIPGLMTRGADRLGAFLGGMGGLFAFIVFCTFVFASDPLAASRRVEAAWHRSQARWPSRVLGPGLVQTCLLVLVSGLLALGLFALAGAAVLWRGGPRGLPSPAATGLLACGESWSAFLVFIVGFLLWSRLRAGSVAGARVLSIAVTTFAVAAPWVAFVVASYGPTKRVYEPLLFASPSPLYAFSVIAAIERGEPHLALTSGLFCSLGWISMGIALFGLGARRATKIVAERRTRRAELDERVAREA